MVVGGAALAEGKCFDVLVEFVASSSSISTIFASSFAAAGAAAGSPKRASLALLIAPGLGGFSALTPSISPSSIGEKFPTSSSAPAPPLDVAAGSKNSSMLLCAPPVPAPPPSSPLPLGALPAAASSSNPNKFLAPCANTLRLEPGSKSVRRNSRP